MTTDTQPEWQTINSAPRETWLRTRREGESGENICAWRAEPGATIQDAEWIERDGGRTTVTHHSFAPPTHWRPAE